MTDINSLIESFGIDRLQKTPHGYRGCCDVNPNHIDRNPSMYINLDKGIVKCFSCGVGKTLFNYLTDKGVSFDIAIDFLLTNFSDSKHRESIEITDYVLGRDLPKSMLDRGFLPSTLKHFGVGYDRYEKRITIPLKFNGKLYGIGYRVYPKKFWATENFVKDNFIYNYEDTEERVLTEGYTDCWRIWQNGTKNVSALLTAYPSEGQLVLLSRHKKLVLALDNDKAGYTGAFRIHRELGREIDISVVKFSGKDAGDLDSIAWKKAINDTRTFSEFEVAMITHQPKLYETIQKELK